MLYHYNRHLLRPSLLSFLENVIVIVIVIIITAVAVKAFTGPSQSPPNGDVTLTTVPSGMVMYTVSSACPTGWTEFTAARGRYIVGVPSGGTVSSTVGTALSNSENRAVGQHGHGITDIGHSHSIRLAYDTTAGSNQYRPSGAGSEWGPPVTVANTTGITINASGTTAGTNAPYIQLKACQKN